MNVAGAPPAKALSPASSEQSGSLLVAAVCTAGAGVLHARVIAQHLQESWLFGLFFIVSAVLQLAWAGAILWRPNRLLLTVGLIVNAAIVAIWVLSRTIGLPLGPDLWIREAVAAPELLATGLEVVSVATLYAILRRGSAPRPTLRQTSKPSRAAAGVVVFAVSATLSVGAPPVGPRVCRHSEISSSPTGPLVPVDGHSMLSRRTPPTLSRPHRAFGLPIGVFVNCASTPARITDIDIETAGDGAIPGGFFVMPTSLAPPGRQVPTTQLERHGIPVDEALVAPTEDRPNQSLVLMVDTTPSTQSLPFLVSVVIVEYSLGDDDYRAPFGSIARVQYQRGGADASS